MDSSATCPFRHTQTPIHSVPVEILVEILGLTREWECWWKDPSELVNDIIPSYGCLKNLSRAFTQVCQNWRHITRNTPHFWSTIRARHTSMDRLNDILGRVGSGVSLNIQFIGPSWNKPDVSIGWLEPIAHRVRVLSLEGHLTDFPTRVFERLEIIEANAVFLGMDYDSVFAFNRLQAPKLRQASIKRCFIDHSPLPPSNLTHIYLRECEIVPSALLDFLGNASSLESLSVQNAVSYHERRLLSPDLIIDLPRLQNFALSGLLPWLVDHLRLPLLSNVMIMGPHAFEPSPYTDLATRSSAQLKSMIFKDSFIFEGQTMQLLDTISTLTEIAFSRTHSQMTQSFLEALVNRADDHSSLVLPNLELMTIIGERGMRGLKTQKITQVLQSRDPSGNAPLRMRKYGTLLRDVFTASSPKRSFADDTIASTLSFDFLRLHQGEITQIFF